MRTDRAFDAAQFVMNKSAVYTKALGHRAQSPGNINHGCALERGLIDGDLDSSQNPQPIKLIAMPGLRNNPAPVKSPTQKRPSFRQRYDQLEARRTELSARLHSLGEAGERQPATSARLGCSTTSIARKSLHSVWQR